MLAPSMCWLSLLPPQIDSALSVVHADRSGRVPVAVLTPVFLQASSNLHDAKGDHQHPRVQALAAGTLSPGSRDPGDGWSPLWSDAV